MAKIISIHSFRGGTGKSNTVANLAVLLAAKGLRVGVVDTDIQSPGIHVLFGMNENAEKFYSLNDYLWGNCSIEKTAHDVTQKVAGNHDGRLFIIPASIKAGEIARVLREGYDVNLMNDGFQALIDQLSLDLLLIDTHPGLNEETLLSIAVSDLLVLILRPDQQDYQGTGVTVEVARRLGVPKMCLVVNKVPQVFSMEEVKNKVEQTYHIPVAAVFPHSEDMMVLGSAGIFSQRFPDHTITETFHQLADLMTQE